jgi:hypothetical protein
MEASISMAITDVNRLRTTVERIVREVKLTDVHTHIYPPCFGDLLLWGVADLITYHYLIAETFRWIDMPYEDYWHLSTQDQSDLIWRTLFLENSPIAESNRGVLTVLDRLGLDVASRNLAAYRNYFAKLSPPEYVDMVFEIANIEEVIMTNDPFDDAERKVWLESYEPDPRFKAALRLDPLLNAWADTWPRLKEWGYEVGEDIEAGIVREVRRFLGEWIDRMEAVYVAVSLPPTFTMPEHSTRSRLITECVLPVCGEKDRPFAMMIGVKKLVNPGLRFAGDSVGQASIETVEHLCATYPRNKFLVTMLARENQHELCVAARKFRNLLIFGCWWFLNNPSLVDEITRMRLELLGLSVVPQHSDARVLDQLIYKWDHSRRVIADALCDKYADIMAAGWRPTEDEITRDVGRLFGGNLWSFLGRKF